LSEVNAQIGTNTVQRDSSGQFVAGNAGGPGRPVGSGRESITKVQIIGQDGVIVSAQKLSTVFDGVITESVWSDMLIKMADMVVSKGSVKAFDSLVKMKGTLIKSSEAGKVDMGALLAAFQAHKDSVLDNPQLSGNENKE